MLDWVNCGEVATPFPWLAAIRVQGSGLGFLGGVCGATAYNASRLMRYLMS